MSSKGGSGTLETVVVEMGHLIEPLAAAGEAANSGDEDAIAELKREMGVPEVDEQVLEDVLAGIVAPYQTIQQNVLVPASKGKTPSVDQVTASIEAVRKVFEAIHRLSNVEVDADDLDGLADAVVDFLITEYLSTYYPQYYAGLQIFGVVKDPTGEPAVVTLSDLGRVFTEPSELFEETLDWGKSGFKAAMVISLIGQIATTQNPWSRLESADVFSLTPRERANPDLNTQLDFPVFHVVEGGASASFGVVVVPVPAAGRRYRGIALVPYAEGSLEDTIDLGGGWELELKLSASTEDLGVVAQPTKDGDTDVEVGVLRDEHKNGSLVEKGPPGGSFRAEATISYTGSEGEPKMVFGDRESGGLFFKQLSLRGVLDAGPEETEFKVELPSKSRIEINPKGGFLEKVFAKGIASDFELTPGFSTQKGFYFSGSVKLQIPITVNTSVGPVTLKEIYVEIGFDPETGTIEPTVAVSADGKLGPIGSSIKRVGVDGTLDLSKDVGNVGIGDLDIGFSPPSGAGLSLDTGPISGGGYLEYDTENERYAGVFDVTIGPVDVKIMGLLTTEMPDGSDGFSLLLNVFGKFPPVQLGFGFTLNGLGGVIGVNRALKSKPLQKATRSGNLDSLLFPEDPVAHAQRIVSDLRSIYPPTRGQHVFGPMARFGWGSPTILTMDLGIVLQLPAAKVSILGKMGVGLPTVEAPKKAQIVRLNLAVSGVLDPERQLFSLDAALYDSRVMLFTVKGGMAMRVGWGDNPKFVLSVGGFNPRFKPPSNFPKVKRVTVCLDIPGGTPSVTWKGYFAVTANTVQVGASFDAKFEAGPISAHAWWGLDALFQFNPFKFVVDFEAGVSVAVFGFELSISLNGIIKGPSPVHINGQLKVTLPGFLPDPSPHVSITIGESKDKREQLPVAKVLPKFGDELAKTDNWSAQMPADGEGIVSLRKIEPAENQVLAHPTGRLSVRQTLVPIDKSIERFGNNRPEHVEFDFEVDAGSADLPPVDAAKKEEFAPEQYRKMSDSEKMNAPTFERWKAGREVSGDLFSWGCTYHDGDTVVARRGNATEATMSYELKQLDSEIEDRADEAFEQYQQLSAPDGGTREQSEGYPVDAARALADDGAVANAESRWRGSEKFEPSTEADGADVEHLSNYETVESDATSWTLGGADGGGGT